MCISFPISWSWRTRWASSAWLSPSTSSILASPNGGRTTNDGAAVTAIDLKACKTMLARARSLGITLAFWNVTSRYDTDSPKSLCAWPFERAYISSDMRIVPCCIIGNPETSDVGDARNMATEWNGPALVEFRKAHLEGRIPAVCKSCYKAPGE
jgi:hypothetical protein